MSRRATPLGSSLDEPARLRVRRPADLLAVIPYLIGFHPRDSLVAVLFRGGEVLLTARLDLPPPGLVDQLADHLRAVTRQHRVEEQVLVVYSDDPDARQLLEGLLVDPASPVRDALHVGSGRWWSLVCTTGCCPENGTPYDPETHPLAAEAVYAGLSVVPDRSDLGRQVGGPPEGELARLRDRLVEVRAAMAALDRTEAARLMARTVRRCRDRGRAPDDTTALQLAVLTEDLVVRDVAWAMMSRRHSEQHLRLWGAVVARTPPEAAAGPLGLLGVAAWIAGNGALQNCCAERLAVLAPEYTLGALLGEISDRALAPSAWEEMAAGLRQEVRAVSGVQRLH